MTQIYSLTVSCSLSYIKITPNPSNLTHLFPGDENTITVGEGSTIADRVMVHCSTYPKEAPTVIGKNVVVNAGAILHGCLLEDGAVVGEGAQVMDGAKVGKLAFVGAGSLVGEYYV